MTQRLDRLRHALYKARPFAAAVVAGLVVGVVVVGAPARAEVVGGAQIPDGAQKVGENRYRAPGDFEDTLKYYRAVYSAGSYPRKSIVNQPGVKAVHISNPSGRNFEGLNIYEANDEVRIYIVPLESTAKPKRAPAKPAKK